MSVSRLTYVTQIGVEQMGDLADRLKDPDVLRLENLDTDLHPPHSALSDKLLLSWSGNNQISTMTGGPSTSSAQADFRAS